MTTAQRGMVNRLADKLRLWFRLSPGLSRIWSMSLVYFKLPPIECDVTWILTANLDLGDVVPMMKLAPSRASLLASQCLWNLLMELLLAKLTLTGQSFKLRSFCPIPCWKAVLWIQTFFVVSKRLGLGLNKLESCVLVTFAGIIQEVGFRGFVISVAIHPMWAKVSLWSFHCLQERGQRPTNFESHSREFPFFAR